MIRSLHGRVLRQRLSLFALALFPLGILACGEGGHAGGKTVETTNGIAGIVQFQGTPAARVQVLLLPANHVPQRDPLLDEQVEVALTDAQGRFAFEDLSAGSYNILVRRPEQDLAGIRQQLEIAEESGLLQLTTTELEPTGSLVLSLQRMPVEEGDVFSLPGTDVYARVGTADLQDGQLRLGGVPPSTYGNLVLMAVGESTGTALELGPSGSQISAGDVSELEPLEHWPHSVGVELSYEELQISEALEQFPVRISLDASHWNLDSVRLESSVLGELPVLCVLEGNRRLPYHISRWNSEAGFADIWVLLDTLPAEGVDTLTLVWNRGAACGRSDSATVFAPAERYGLVAHLQEVVFDSTTSIPYAGLLGQPAALTLTAEIAPDSGLMGGEVVSLGNHFGFRVDALPEQLGIYGYYSIAGPSNWGTISGYSRGSYPIRAVVSLVVDPVVARYEIYVNGSLHSAYDSALVVPLTWDKGGTDIIIGKHPTRDEGFYQGRMGAVLLSPSALSPSWIQARDRQLQGLGVRILL